MPGRPGHGHRCGDHRGASRLQPLVLARSRRRDHTGALVLLPRPACRDPVPGGRRAGIATLMWVCAFFRTLDYLVAPSAHDVLDMIPTQIGWALTAGGIGWSVVAIVCGARPAREPEAYRRRTALAAAFFVLGAALMTTTVLGRPGWWGLPVGYGVAGIGMGLTHLDTMNRIVTDPAEPDGITHAQAATAVTIAGATGSAVLGTVATAFVAPTGAGVEAGRLWPTLAVLAAGLILTPLLARRAA